MKEYTFEIIIKEGNDEFWEEITEAGKTGVDDVLKLVREIFDSYGLDEDNTSVRLKNYTEN